MSNQNHFMSKDDGPVIKVALNDWAAKRNAGYIFRTEKDYAAQEANGADQDDGDVRPTMENTKAEITEYLEANGYDVDQNDTKAELLAALDS